MQQKSKKAVPSIFAAVERGAFSAPVPRGLVRTKRLKNCLRPPQEHGSGCWVGDGCILQGHRPGGRCSSHPEGEGSARACQEHSLLPAYDSTRVSAADGASKRPLRVLNRGGWWLTSNSQKVLLPRHPSCPESRPTKTCHHRRKVFWSWSLNAAESREEQARGLRTPGETNVNNRFTVWFHFYPESGT